MEPDPVLASNTREWLLRAKEDLANAQHDLVATPPFVRDALFHCQQVVDEGAPYVARLSLSENPQSGGVG
jgi:HEPN domain-containing protein